MNQQPFFHSHKIANRCIYCEIQLLIPKSIISTHCNVPAYYKLQMADSQVISDYQSRGLSAGTGKHCVFGLLELVFIWSCFVFCLLFLLFYIISAPVLAEAAQSRQGT